MTRGWKCKKPRVWVRTQKLCGIKVCWAEVCRPGRRGDEIRSGDCRRRCPTLERCRRPCRRRRSSGRHRTCRCWGCRRKSRGRRRVTSRRRCCCRCCPNCWESRGRRWGDRCRRIRRRRSWAERRVPGLWSGPRCSPWPAAASWFWSTFHCCWSNCRRTTSCWTTATATKRRTTTTGWWPPPEWPVAEFRTPGWSPSCGIARGRWPSSAGTCSTAPASALASASVWPARAAWASVPPRDAWRWSAVSGCTFRPPSTSSSSCRDCDDSWSAAELHPTKSFSTGHRRHLSPHYCCRTVSHCVVSGVSLHSKIILWHGTGAAAPIAVYSRACVCVALCSVCLWKSRVRNWPSWLAASTSFIPAACGLLLLLLYSWSTSSNLPWRPQVYSLGAGRERVIVSASAAGTYLPVSQISFPSLASCFCHHLFLHLLFQLEIASTFPSTISHTYRKDPETSRQKGPKDLGLK